MTRRALEWCSIVACLGAGACQLQARSPDEYRKDTRALVDTRTPELRSCYDGALGSDPNASGSVVVRFVVSRQTGVVKNVEILPQSTASRPIQNCVQVALYGTTLQPPDERDGEATFVWTFDRS